MTQLVRHWALVPLVDSGGGERLGSTLITRTNHEEISFSAAILCERSSAVLSCL